MKPRVKRADSDTVRANIRAWAGLRGLSTTELARRMGHASSWVSKRIGPNPSVALTIDDGFAFAEALDCSIVDFFRDMRPADGQWVGAAARRSATELMQKRYPSGRVATLVGTPVKAAA